MKILIVCSSTRNRIAPFILDQVEALKNAGIEVEYFKIINGGLSGYLRALFELRQKIKNVHFDLVHAHYGFSGLLSTFQRKLPAIITFHGSDINNTKRD